MSGDLDMNKAVSKEIEDASDGLCSNSDSDVHEGFHHRSYEG
jgi:hypothetical protein